MPTHTKAERKKNRARIGKVFGLGSISKAGKAMKKAAKKVKKRKKR